MFHLVMSRFRLIAVQKSTITALIQYWLTHTIIQRRECRSKGTETVSINNLKRREENENSSKNDENLENLLKNVKI